MTIDNTTSTIDGVIEAVADLFHAFISAQGNDKICVAAFMFFLARILFSVLQLDYLAGATALANKAVIAAMSAGGNSEAYSAACSVFVFELLNYLRRFD